MSTNSNKRIKVFTFRTTEALLSKITEIAEKEKRTIAKQIEFILEEHLKKQKEEK